MTLSISQQDQVNTSGGSVTPPSDAILLVAMIGHESSASGSDDYVYWAGAAETQYQYDMHSGHNSNTYERTEIWVIPEPDVSGTGAFHWENTSTMDARLYWITSDDADCNPYALVTDVDEGNGNTTSVVGSSGDEVVLFVISQNADTTMSGCTADQKNLTSIHWGHEEPWVDGVASTSSSSGSPGYAGIALKDKSEPRAEVVWPMPALITASGGSATKPALATFAVICFSHGPNARSWPTSVTLGGEACTKVAEDGGGSYEGAAIWYLDDPAGEGALTLTWSGNHQAQIIWMRNIDHDSPLVASDVNSPSDFSASGSAGDITVYCQCHQSSNAAGFTEKAIYTPFHFGRGGYRSFAVGTRSLSGSVASTGGNNAHVGAIFAYADDPIPGDGVPGRRAHVWF
jgi:hypothetical protein